MTSIFYHATCDASFHPRVEHVPAHETIPEYFRLHLNPGTIIFLSRKQLVQIHDAIREGYQPAESDESYEASEALQKYREIPPLRPITATTAKLTAPEFRNAAVAEPLRSMVTRWSTGSAPRSNPIWRNGGGPA